MKKKLSNARNEKDVENIYRAELIAALKDAEIVSPFGSDGLLKAPPDIRTLLEFKYDELLKSKPAQCGVLIQIIYYLKKFEDAGKKLPSTIFVGDINECFALRVNKLLKYLEHEIDWTVAPSAAAKRNRKLLQAMVDDVDILPFVYDVDEKFNIRTVIAALKDLSENVVRKIKVTEKNLESIFEYFNNNVLGEKLKLTTNERANLFIQIIINPEENYLHPQEKKKILVTKGFGNISINRSLFRSFFEHFEGEKYTPRDKEKFTGFVDRLVEDVTRRRKGEFFTPTLFVDKAHEYISKTLGKNWKEEYVVWDCAAGTGNLTRDYKFKELYISTMEQSDIDTLNQMGYNPEATRFQYNFLNDGAAEDMFDESALPEELNEAIESGRKVLFFINPPYATGANFGKTHKKNSASNKINQEMRRNGWGACVQNLYAQFLYRIWRFRQINPNVCVAIFCPPLFLSGSSFGKFRKLFFASFGFEDGFLLKASNFSNVKDDWGISFSIFNSKGNTEQDFNFDVLDLNIKEFSIANLGKRSVYNTDIETSASEWVREKTKKLKTQKDISLKNALTVYTGTDNRGGNIPGSLGYMVIGSNNVDKNAQQVSLWSKAFYNGNGLSVMPQNFDQCTALFAARKIINKDWINCKDEYLAPNTKHPLYKQFAYDSIVVSLFHIHAYQTSLRRVECGDKNWDIKNEFFWLSSKDMLELANKNGYDNLYKDAKTAEERFVYKKLFEEGIYDQLSPDAKKVLDAATTLLKKSIKMRAIMAEEYPEHHLDSFDAGYAQLKLVWKEYFKEEFEAFRKLYKKLEDRLRPQVYEVGFLKD